MRPRLPDFETEVYDPLVQLIKEARGGGLLEPSMRLCTVKWIEYPVDRWVYHTGDGLFHQWGTECGEGSPAYTVGIVELSDGRIKTIAPDNITFKVAL